MSYPSVLGERETLDLVLSGRSLARYGDGELNLCLGRGIPCQTFDAALAGRLTGILKHAEGCLVGIPNLESATPKAPFWRRYRATGLYADRPYVSAFVTRPDSAPWIDTPDYWRAVESLWLGQDVTLVRGGARSLTAVDLRGAACVTEIIAPREHAWQGYADLLARIGRPKRALLCLGPTATVLAVDLCAHGVHAIDLGHIGMFLKKHRHGQPMVVTAEDKAA